MSTSAHPSIRGECNTSRNSLIFCSRTKGVIGAWIPLVGTAYPRRRQTEPKWPLQYRVYLGCATWESGVKSARAPSLGCDGGGGGRLKGNCLLVSFSHPDPIALGQDAEKNMFECQNALFPTFSMFVFGMVAMNMRID